jgi:hypothetical protein
MPSGLMREDLRLMGSGQDPSAYGSTPALSFGSYHKKCKATSTMRSMCI